MQAILGLSEVWVGAQIQILTTEVVTTNRESGRKQPESGDRSRTDRGELSADGEFIGFNTLEFPVIESPTTIGDRQQVPGIMGDYQQTPVLLQLRQQHD
jgi:hypothetical protein